MNVFYGIFQLVLEMYVKALILSDAAISLDDCFFISPLAHFKKFLWRILRFNASFYWSFIFLQHFLFLPFKLCKCNYNKVPFRRSNSSGGKRKIKRALWQNAGVKCSWCSRKREGTLRVLEIVKCSWQRSGWVWRKCQE